MNIEQIKKEARENFQKAYDLGYKHGLEIGKKQKELELLQEEIERLTNE